MLIYFVLKYRNTSCYELGENVRSALCLRIQNLHEQFPVDFVLFSPPPLHSMARLCITLNPRYSKQEGGKTTSVQ